MATCIFEGNASDVAQIDTLTPATVEIGDIFTATLTGEDDTTQSVSFTATDATVLNVTAGLAAAMNASDLSLFRLVTAVDATTHITVTADTAGVPFYLTTSTTDGGGNDTQTLAQATTTANSGDNDLNTVANYSGGAKAVNGDTLIFTGDSDILYGLNQSAVTVAVMNRDQSFTGKVGQPADAVIGNSDAFLQIGATIANIGHYYGAGSVTGSTRFWWDAGSDASTITIHNTASVGEGGRPPVRIRASNAATTIYVRKGKVGVAYGDDETTTVGTIEVSGEASDTSVVVGSGTTLTTYKQKAGSGVLRCAATTVEATGGTLLTEGSGAYTTATIGDAAKAYLNSSGTITTLEGAGTIDMRGSRVARTVTNCKLYKGAALYADYSVVTFTNGVDCWQCDTDDVTLWLGRHVTLTPSAAA